MDTEQQVRLNFLEEAEEYFEQLESILLNLAAADNRSQPLNEALRAAHSIKGSAGMMGYMPMSRVAHRLEDFLKILQARKIELDTELETLLLSSVDCLRQVKQLHFDNANIDEAWWQAEAEPIFSRLRDRLGDLTDADEDRLLSAEENVDIDMLMFTSGVEGTLDKFENERSGYDTKTLRQALTTTTTKLLEFGFIGQVEPFMALCESIQGYCSIVPDPELAAFTDLAISLWWQSHALASIGRVEQLPNQISWTVTAPAAIGEAPTAPPITDISLDDLNSLQANLAALTLPDPTSAPPTPEIPTLDIDLANIAAAITNTLETIAPASVTEEADSTEPPTDTIDLTELAKLQATISQIELPDIPAIEPTPVAVEPAPTIAAPPKVELPKLEVPQLSKTRSGKNSSVRVSLEQFRQINNLFSSLILERNSVNLRLEQLQDLMTLLQERMRTLDGFNQGLRQWYDKASIEGIVGSEDNTNSDGFDTLEMDSYSQLHLLAQEQMETLVKLQEVIADLDLTTQEMQQANTSLNYTSRSLQTRITRAQMRPFADIVGRFPRVVRDLSVKYGKQVNLNISGESTLFERVALDVLTDPLNHLLRNSFDHGIEDPATRLAQGKPAEGTITLRAMQRGNKAIVTIQDDGKGISFDKIREKVRQHGIPEDRVMSMTRKELLDLIFEAGFSTADKVTELSGRGVGMDVVKSNLKEVQGDIQVETEPGKGSKFTISIPLTLSILRVMLLETNGLVFALPIELVKELTLFQADKLQTQAGQSTIQWQGQTIPIAMADQYWQFQSSAKLMEMDGTPVIDHPLLIVVGEEDRCYGFRIQRFWGEQEVAIRPVSSPLPLPDGFSGVTVLGDGRIVPMVDPVQLYNAIATQSDQPQNSQVSTTPEIRKSSNRVLVVDDSVHARRYLAISLEKAGYTVEQAKDGQEAVDRLLGGLEVEAVICDVEMPRLDGYGVLSAIKSRSEFKNLPITMLTSRSSDKHRRLAMNLGATAYFSKPYNEQELLQTLQEVM
jgi:two-component system, chemotaxis family, sensor histidine kinase and response regulator PixL